MLLALLNLRWTFGIKFGKKQVALVLVYFTPSKSQVNQGLSMKWEDSNAENTIWAMSMKNLLLPWLLINIKIFGRTLNVYVLSTKSLPLLTSMVYLMTMTSQTCLLINLQRPWTFALILVMCHLPNQTALQLTCSSTIFLLSVSLWGN